MDDIICPECGRPNLCEAKKCWYCQTELTDQMDAQADDNPQVPEKIGSVPVQPDPKPVIEELEEDIPEWLAKIRHKIEEERGPEDELPFWKQKDIFGGEKMIDAKTAKEKRAQRSSNTKSGKRKARDIEENLPIISESDQKDNLEDLSDDLPEGFTKL